MSLTWNSSKQSSAASAAMASASGGIGSSPSGLARLPGVDAPVRVLHEAVEMDAPLARAPGRGEEQVHQHRLAAADLADQVEPARAVLVGAVGRAAAHEAGKHAAVRRRPARRIVAAQLQPTAPAAARRPAPAPDRGPDRRRPDGRAKLAAAPWQAGPDRWHEHPWWRRIAGNRLRINESWRGAVRRPTQG